ncbi:unnamed protein product, partial [Didymodactylos carnosus]
LMNDRGFKRELDKIQVVCIDRQNNCEWFGILKDYQEHYDKCHSDHLCMYCHETFLSKSDLDKHINDTCPKAVVSCSLTQYGCPEHIERLDYGNHLTSAEHQSSVLECLKHFQQHFHLRNNQKNMKQQTKMEYESREEPASNHAIIPLSDCYSQLQTCSETVMILSQGIQTLSHDATRLSTEALTQQSLMQLALSEVNQLKISIAEKESNSNAIASNQEALLQELSSLKEKVANIEFVSTDGTLTWKITNVSDKMTNAQSERPSSIYSPPFYSSPAGYKMKVRLYLYGDGNARRTHISLFFVIVRGEYDQILKWPFNHTVTFCLLDQSGQNRHAIDSFRPDTKSNSFLRPQSEMNIASGIPKFFPLPMIQQDNNNYVRDDTMFIKVIVDFADLSKMILPYMLSLNPGLPHHVQQYIIQQEIQRRQNLAQTPVSPLPNLEAV